MYGIFELPGVIVGTFVRIKKKKRELEKDVRKQRSKRFDKVGISAANNFIERVN